MDAPPSPHTIAYPLPPTPIVSCDYYYGGGGIAKNTTSIVFFGDDQIVFEDPARLMSLWPLEPLSFSGACQSWEGGWIV